MARIFVPRCNRGPQVITVTQPTFRIKAVPIHKTSGFPATTARMQRERMGKPDVRPVGGDCDQPMKADDEGVGDGVEAV